MLNNNSSQWSGNRSVWSVKGSVTRSGMDQKSKAGVWRVENIGSVPANRYAGSWDKNASRVYTTPSYISSFRVVKESNTSNKITKIINSEIEDIQKKYFEIKKYEIRNQMNSRDMFNKWKRGEIRGAEYNDWVNSYIKVWRSLE